MESSAKWLSSPSSSSYLFVLYFYINLLITIDCALNGMISPIEVVEEWACHNTEIRLTCRNIESKIAILEASFTPNCTANDDTCEHLNSDKINLMVSRQKLDPQLVHQTEAGRRFLEALRQQDLIEEKASTPPNPEPMITAKEKRNSMRASLERLIVKYLRKITSDSDDDDMEDASERRNRRNLNNSTQFTFGDDIAKMRDDNFDKTNGDKVSDDEYESAEEDDADEEASTDDGLSEQMDGNKIKHSMWNGNLQCSEKRRRITQLDRFELQKSVENEMDNEINIRNVLSYRCSGKNLCSFVFAADHPYSAVWNSGLVHIKYICMDSYRINKYCNEHLVIGNEAPLDDEEALTHQRYAEIHSRRRPLKVVEREEPRAEALTQHSDRNLQYFHQQLHNLKILKPSDSETDDVTAVEELDRLRQEKEQRRKLSHKQRMKQGVYSQDFRIMKVLPSNLDQFNDIEQIGDEFYFKKDVETDSPPDVTTGPTRSTVSDSENEIDEIHAVPEILVRTSHMDDVESTMASQIEKSNEIDSNEETTFDEASEEDEDLDADEYEHWNATTDYKIVIREGDEVITKFPELKSRVSPPVSSQRATELGMLQIHMNTTYDWNNEVVVRHPKNVTVADEEQEEKVEEQIFIKRIQESFHQAPSNFTEPPFSQLHTKSGDAKETEFDNSVEGGGARRNEKITVYEEESYENYEDSYERQLSEDESYEAEDGYRKLKNRKYKSIQRTSLGRPLIQGFSMSPGYPKFYIGNTECSWKIIAPKDQRIKITILDIDLRYDDNCMDQMEIVDTKIHRMLFSSCSEIEKPKQIISDSNTIEIKLKTRTNVAYPKRGVLFHYAALGCILPVLPAHVLLVDRTESSASYKCINSFVFPDTGSASRELFCTIRHTWSTILPDCIEKSHIVGSGLVTRFDHNRKDPPSTMSEKEADTVFDIVIPSLLIVGLLAVNAIIFAVIMHYRNKRNDRLDLESKELAEL